MAFWWSGRNSTQIKNTVFVLVEGEQVIVPMTQDPSGLLLVQVTSHQDDLRRMSILATPLTKALVRRSDGELVTPGILPNLLVVGAYGSNVTDVEGPWKEISQFVL